MIKIAFFDIDGTLLKMGHRELTEKTAKALNSLRQKGILLCMATGRGSLSIPAFQDVTFDVLLTFNGSYVTIGEKIIFKNPLNHHDKQQIIRNLKKMNRAAAISNEHFIVTNGTDQDLEQYFRFGNEILTIAENFDAADIIPLNCGKGNAVNAVLDYYGFSKEEAIAFGDGENDIEMLEAVGTGVAMGNARYTVKARAAAICRPVEEDGVYYYCLENNLITGI